MLLMVYEYSVYSNKVIRHLVVIIPAKANLCGIMYIFKKWIISL